MINDSNKICRENQNTHFVFSNFFRNSCCLWDNFAKCVGVREATKAHTCCGWISKATRLHAHAHAPGHPHTRTHVRTRECKHPLALALARTHIQIRTSSCFFTATVLSRMRLNVTLYAHCLSCFVNTWSLIQGLSVNIWWRQFFTMHWVIWQLLR